MNNSHRWHWRNLCPYAWFSRPLCIRARQTNALRNEFLDTLVGKVEKLRTRSWSVACTQ